jgi:hypothetical protein
MTKRYVDILWKLEVTAYGYLVSLLDRHPKYLDMESWQ